MQLVVGGTLPTDNNAHYYQLDVRADPGMILTIAGAYPQARYASFQVYHAPEASFITGIRDTFWLPDPGSVNPFVMGTPRGIGTYTVRALFARQPIHPLPRTMYIDSVRGQVITLIYRLYLPDAAAEPQGNVPLPAVTATYTNSTAPAGCPLPR